MRSTHGLNLKRKHGPLFLLLALSLVGCATQSPISALECPTFPSKPAALEPTPDYDYLERAKNDISKWQQELKDISKIP